MKEFYSPDFKSLQTFQGRLAQARRELAALLVRDLTYADLAGEVPITPAAMSGWVNGAMPSRQNLQALAAVFERAGLPTVTTFWLEYGEPPEVYGLSEDEEPVPTITPPVARSYEEQEAAKKKTAPTRRARGGG